MTTNKIWSGDTALKFLEDRINDLENETIASVDVTTIVKLTQAAYDLLTPDANTMYIIVG